MAPLATAAADLFLLLVDVFGNVELGFIRFSLDLHLKVPENPREVSPKRSGYYHHISRVDTSKSRFITYGGYGKTSGLWFLDVGGLWRRHILCWVNFGE